MLDMLKWLWDVAIGLILEKLAIRKPPSGNDWPHIWWIPTGSLCHLPIHAAGYHLENSSRTVLDRAVSSYSPSIKSLVFSYKNKSLRPPESSEKIVLVSMDTTPGMNTLPHVQTEIKKLERLLPASIPRVGMNTPQRVQVLDELTGCNIFHFAGHGISDPSDPSRSSLVVSDAPLTVEDLISKKLHRNPPLLACLSACATGNNKVDELIDEGIHLMGACQMAGFRHVIGSLWAVSDSHCAEVAEAVYATMIKNAMSDKSVSLGLHNAARTLRGGLSKLRCVGEDRNAKLVGSGKEKAFVPNDPYYWAAYIHMGI
jgi:CHAT domain-containing protein